MKQIR